MLVMGRYAQWKSRFLRYIDTRPNGDALRKCILQGPYTPSIVKIPAVPTIDDTLAVPERTTVETILNMSSFLRSSAKLNLSSSSNLLPSCALVKKNMISEFAEALTPL
ncbi:hypothetical protein Tco_0914467 [Tanacetum coccineum]